MNDEMKREVHSLLVTVRDEYKRLHASGENATVYCAVVAKAVDVLEDLHGMTYGQKPWRCVR